MKSACRVETARASLNKSCGMPYICQCYISRKLRRLEVSLAVFFHRYAVQLADFFFFYGIAIRRYQKVDGIGRVRMRQPQVIVHLRRAADEVSFILVAWRTHEALQLTVNLWNENNHDFKGILHSLFVEELGHKSLYATSLKISA